MAISHVLTTEQSDRAWFRRCFLAVLVKEYPEKIPVLLEMAALYFDWVVQVDELRENCPHKKVCEGYKKASLFAKCGCNKEIASSPLLALFDDWLCDLNLQSHHWLRQPIFYCLWQARRYSSRHDAFRFLLENPPKRVSHYGEQFVFPQLNLERWNYDHWDELWESYKTAALLYWQEKGFEPNGSKPELEKHLRWSCWHIVEALSYEDIAAREYRRFDIVLTRQGIGKSVKEILDKVST